MTCTLTINLMQHSNLQICTPSLNQSGPKGASAWLLKPGPLKAMTLVVLAAAAAAVVVVVVVVVVRHKVIPIFKLQLTRQR